MGRLQHLTLKIIGTSACAAVLVYSGSCKPGKPAVPAADPLSREWALYLRENPGAAMEPGMAKARAQELRAQGFVLYRAKNDAAAVTKYEEGLRLFADSEAYYDYGNSLSNLQGRLEDSITAYKIGIEVSSNPPANLYYNLACAESRANRGSEAIENLKIAYRLGKDLAVMETDADLVNVRRIEDWRASVMTAGLPDFESPAGKAFLEAMGGGFRSTTFCGKPGDRHGILVHKWDSYGQSSGTRTGTWALKSGEIHFHYTHEKGAYGTGPSTQGPRGPVYSQFETYEKQIDERGSMASMTSMLRDISGPCPE